MTPELVTPPDNDAIFALLDAAAVKKNLRVGHAREDDLIGDWIRTAHSVLDGIDGWVRRPVLEAEYRQSFRRFDRYLELWVPTPSEIVEVTYAGGLAPVDPASYQLLFWKRVPYLRFLEAYAFPDVAGTTTLAAVTVQYKAKYPPAENALRQAMMLLASHWYRNREESFADPRQSLTNHKIEWGIKATLGRFQAPLRYEGAA